MKESDYLRQSVGSERVMLPKLVQALASNRWSFPRPDILALHSAILCCCIMLFSTSPAEAGLADKIAFYRFSGVIGRSLGEAINYVHEARAQKAIANAEIAEHRQKFFELYPDKAGFKDAERQFAEDMLAKDYALAMMAVPEGPHAGIFKTFDKISGGEIDGGILPPAVPAFERWIIGIREYMGASDHGTEGRRGEPIIADANKMLEAWIANEKLYQAYATKRTWAEFERAGRLNDFLDSPGKFLAFHVQQEYAKYGDERSNAELDAMARLYGERTLMDVAETVRLAEKNGRWLVETDQFRGAEPLPSIVQTLFDRDERRCLVSALAIHNLHETNEHGFLAVEQQISELFEICGRERVMTEVANHRARYANDTPSSKDIPLKFLRELPKNLRLLYVEQTEDKDLQDDGINQLKLNPDFTRLDAGEAWTDWEAVGFDNGLLAVGCRKPDSRDEYVQIYQATTGKSTMIHSPFDGSTWFGRCIDLRENVLLVGASDLRQKFRVAKRGRWQTGSRYGKAALINWRRGTVVHELEAPEDFTERFGRNVCLTREHALVSTFPGRQAQLETDNAVVHVYETRSGQFEKTISESGARLLGAAMCSTDDIVVISNLGDEDRPGGVYVYDIGLQKRQTRLQPPSGVRVADYGRAVAADKELIVVGARDTAFVYQLETAQCVNIIRLTDSKHFGTSSLGVAMRKARGASNGFGSSVELTKDYILVGSSRAAHVFDRKTALHVADYALPSGSSVCSTLANEGDSILVVCSPGHPTEGKLSAQLAPLPSGLKRSGGKDTGDEASAAIFDLELIEDSEGNSSVGWIAVPAGLLIFGALGIRRIFRLPILQ